MQDGKLGGESDRRGWPFYYLSEFFQEEVCLRLFSMISSPGERSECEATSDRVDSFQTRKGRKTGPESIRQDRLLVKE